MGLLKSKKSGEKGSDAAAVQTGSFSRHPYWQLSGFTPMSINGRIYASLRESIPLIDTAVLKIIRLLNDFSFNTGNKRLDNEMNSFFEVINVGGNQTGINAFISTYLSELLTYGSAVGEIVADSRNIYALYNGELDSLEVKRAENNLDLEFYNNGERLPHQELILFSALNPRPGEILGISLLQGLPFISDILLTIYNTIGENWEHAGNIRYAVTYKPGDNADGNTARERAEQIAGAWREAMNSKAAVKDFVAVGDVSVDVIGADNNVLSSEVPVRQLLEQIVSKTGLPPYMLGLSWSSTERMSAQQADVLTTELEAYRRILNPVLIKIAEKYLETRCISAKVSVDWTPITLQDETESARASLYNAQAEKILKEASL